MDDDEEVAGVPEWVVTYGDMMSLLLTFFIMLVSLSQLKEEGRMRAMLDAIRESFGADLGTSGVPGQSLQTNSANTSRASQGRTSEGGAGKGGRNSQGRAGPHETVSSINHGTVLTLGGPSLFSRFSAELTDELKENLRIIADTSRELPNRIIVRGHASPEPLPPESPFADPWDLSFARAAVVAEHLVGLGIARERLIVSAVGDSEPRVVTRDLDQQRQNRRVDVFLVDSYISAPEQSAESAE